MAGHSKWANIKHRKGRADAIKGKIFSRIAKEIISSVRMGGPDPKGNTHLRLAIQRAREANMPSENVERTIKKAGGSDQADYHHIIYEIYGYGGVGIIVEALTDNKNRMASDIRIALNKNGGTMANPGAVTFNFDQKGIIRVDKEGIDMDVLFLAVTEAGAEDFKEEEETYLVITEPHKLYSVKDALKEVKVLETELVMIPKTIMQCGLEDEKANMLLIEWFEDLDDVDTVFHNMSME